MSRPSIDPNQHDQHDASAQPAKRHGDQLEEAVNDRAEAEPDQPES